MNMLLTIITNCDILSKLNLICKHMKFISSLIHSLERQMPFFLWNRADFEKNLSKWALWAAFRRNRYIKEARENLELHFYSKNTENVFRINSCALKFHSCWSKIYFKIPSKFCIPSRGYESCINMWHVFCRL